VSRVAPYIDLLTGAWKKDYFELRLARAVSQAQRSRLPLALVHLDVDELQEHNDLHGQPKLDQALGWLAAQLSAVVDGRGPIARLAGGAFAVYLRSCSRSSALHLAERIRGAVARAVHHSELGNYRLTISVGIATLRRGEPWGNFVEAAEEACRKAKQGGRDGVACR
jgi:diguanylate cyclase (GGDEF)-like protein